jgi:phage tail sheath protein FI
MIADPELFETDVIVIPGLTNKTLTDRLINLCEERADSIALIDIENDYIPVHEGTAEVQPVVATAISSLKARKIDSSYAAAYYPAVYDASAGIFLPASIAALGVLGGTEGRSALWFAPAGFNRGGLNRTNSGLNVSRAAVALTSKQRDDMYVSNINPIATFPREGVVIFGQKTLQATPSALDRVNVRRLMNYIKRQISRASTLVLFEPNVEATWNNFKGIVEPFLLSVKNAFGLDDFRVVLDSRTTTADLVDRNIMYAKIILKPTKSIEFIALDFVITNTGAVFTEQ